MKDLDEFESMVEMILLGNSNPNFFYFKQVRRKGSHRTGARLWIKYPPTPFSKKNGARSEDTSLLNALLKIPAP